MYRTVRKHLLTARVPFFMSQTPRRQPSSAEPQLRGVAAHKGPHARHQVTAVWGQQLAGCWKQQGTCVCKGVEKTSCIQQHTSVRVRAAPIAAICEPLSEPGAWGMNVAASGTLSQGHRLRHHLRRGWELPPPKPAPAHNPQTRGSEPISRLVMGLVEVLRV